MMRLSILILLLSATHLYGQTKAIAFKSHSGNLAHYSTDGDRNFGNIVPMSRLNVPRLDSIVKINEITIIQYNNAADGSFYYDTLVNHPFWCQPNINIDSLKITTYGDVKFVGFNGQQNKDIKGHVAKPKHGNRIKSIIALNMTCKKPLAE